MERKKIYFASDFHLGAPNEAESLKREKRIVRWLRAAALDAKEIYLVGDIFDFWFEYKRAIPRGFSRLQGAIAEITDAGIPVHLFTGNHDMWIFDYLPKELGVTLYRAPIVRTYYGKTFFIGHGDGLGPGDKGYKFLKKVFASPVCQWLFARLHPNFGIWLADRSSKKSRAATGNEDEKFLGEENEWLALYAKRVLSRGTHIDYFIFGHRHLPMEIEVGPNAKYINLGEWIHYDTYVVFDGENCQLLKWDDQDETTRK